MEKTEFKVKPSDFSMIEYLISKKAQENLTFKRFIIGLSKTELLAFSLYAIQTGFFGFNTKKQKHIVKRLFNKNTREELVNIYAEVIGDIKSKVKESTVE